MLMMALVRHDGADADTEVLEQKTGVVSVGGDGGVQHLVLQLVSFSIPLRFCSERTARTGMRLTCAQ